MPPPVTGRLRARLAGALGAFVVAAAVTACSSPTSYDVVNLGDSFSAGIGSGEVTSLSVRPHCLQGDGPNHISELDAHPQATVLVDAACSGLDSAGISAVLDEAMVSDALSRADVVTLTIGGNDLAWVQTIVACSTFSSEDLCEVALRQTAARIGTAADAASDTLAQIATASPGRVVVLGYPHLLDPQPRRLPISPGRALQLNRMTDQLNAALRHAAEASGATFVDVTDRFAGHGLGSEDPWINLDMDNLGATGNLHPNRHGYLSGYLPALLEELGLPPAGG